jgi:hypothetical protein
MKGFLRPLVLGLLALLPLLACSSGAAPAADVCAEAKNRFAACGTSLPLLSDGPCTGTTRIVARCVVDHAHDCDELATLFARIDACVADMLDGGDSLLPPATDLPVPLRDGGTPDARTDAGVAPPKDSGTDAAPLDAGVDAGPVAWPGLDATGTVALAEERRFQTPLLPAGTYSFATTGTGDVDLYVRKTTAPTTATYDCRPFLTGSTESCTVTLAAPAIVHVMIRGEVTTSTFTLEGRP